MASVCGGCLALLDAGVPIKCSVAGIAMGLVLETKEFGGDGTPLILSDISGSEDASGDMDFKVQPFLFFLFLSFFTCNCLQGPLQGFSSFYADLEYLASLLEQLLC